MTSEEEYNLLPMKRLVEARARVAPTLEEMDSDEENAHGGYFDFEFFGKTLRKGTQLDLSCARIRSVFFCSGVFAVSATIFVICSSSNSFISSLRKGVYLRICLQFWQSGRTLCH